MCGQQQRGLSALGMIATVAVVAAVIVLSLRLGPHYIDYYTLRAVMDDLPADQIHGMDKAAIRESLEKRFKINNLRSFSVRDVVTIDKTREETNILVSYEVREPLVYNADVVLVFEQQYSYRP